jgi:hypothetical protein
MKWTLKSTQEPPIGEEKLWVTNTGKYVLATRNQEKGWGRYEANTHFVLGYDYDSHIDADEWEEGRSYANWEYLYAWRNPPKLPKLPPERKVEPKKEDTERSVKFRYQPRICLVDKKNPVDISDHFKGQI